MQQRLGGVATGMARAAVVASRSADELEERRKRRREAQAASARKRRKAVRDAAAETESESDGEDEAGESEGEGEGEGEGEAGEREGEGEAGGESEDEGEDERVWQPPSQELREELRTGGTDTVERRLDDARYRAWLGAGATTRVKLRVAPGRPAGPVRVQLAVGLPGYRAPSPFEMPLTRGERGCCCPHGFRETEDWYDGDCGFYSGFSSDCINCIGIRLASDACASAIAEYHEMVGATVGVRLWVPYGRRVRVHLAVGPDGQDPPDPYGTASADCFYEKPPEGADDAGTRRLAGGLSFALPDEVHGAAKHGGPPEPERKRKAAALEEPEPDWAPYTAAVAKPADFYANYDARCIAGA